MLRTSVAVVSPDVVTPAADADTAACSLLSLIEMLSRFIVSGFAPTLGISINGLAPS